MISDVDYNTTLKSLLNSFWFFNSCRLLICSSIDMGCSQKRCTKGGDRVRGCITHLLSIKNSNVDGFHVSVVINI